MTAPDSGDQLDLPGFEDPGLDESGLVELLTRGELDVIGRLVDASNATLYCSVSLAGATVACVHKPIAGERPLWDFPDGTLAAREVGAYLVSAATGWNLVPPTVLREGPWGPGMCQLWIDVDPTVDLARLVRTDDDRLRRIAVLDAVINNADRKGGHLLPTVAGDVYGIDHGLCFALPNKLRTLLWGWAGAPLPDEAGEVLARLEAEWAHGLGPALADLLTPREAEGTRRRLVRLRRTGIHPEPREDGWPAIPWPPFEETACGARRAPRRASLLAGTAYRRLRRAEPSLLELPSRLSLLTSAARNTRLRRSACDASPPDHRMPAEA